LQFELDLSRFVLSRFVSRDVVRLAVEKSRAFTGRPLPGVARYLRALHDGMDPDEQRKMLYKFTNFLYKTVRL